MHTVLKKVSLVDFSGFGLLWILFAITSKGTLSQNDILLNVSVHKYIVWFVFPKKCINAVLTIFRNNAFIAKYLSSSIIGIHPVLITISTKWFVLNFCKGTLERKFIFFSSILPWYFPSYLSLCCPILTNSLSFSLWWGNTVKKNKYNLSSMYQEYIFLCLLLFCFF